MQVGSDEIAFVLVRLNHVARRIVNTNHSIMSADLGGTTSVPSNYAFTRDATFALVGGAGNKRKR